jgi:putative spermidine/putrescine transport system permease protein
VAEVTTDVGARGALAQPMDDLDAVEAAPAPGRRSRRRGSAVAWAIVVVAAVYFVVPLLATLLFSLKARPFGQAYLNVLGDPGFVGSLIFSFVIATFTIIGSFAIVVPTAYWVRLRYPGLRPVVEFLTLLPFVIPPVILVFGLIRTFGSRPLALTSTDLGSDLLLVAAYMVLALPYTYRSVDVGLRSLDIGTLTEAAQSMGAGWLRILWQVILPNLRPSLLSGAFLTLAIVMGEFTIATFLVRPAFGPYLSLLGQSRAYEPAAVALISFGITWLAMGLLGLVARGSRTRIQVAGAR